MDAAPPTRKYEIMSGSTNAALNASASVPLPKSHTMYLTRTSPIMRDRKVEAMSTTVAEKTLCACEGCRRARPRPHQERAAGEEGCVEDVPATVSILPG